MKPHLIRVLFLAAVGGAGATGAAAQSADRSEAPVAILARAIANQPRIRLRLATGTIVELDRARLEGAALVGRSRTRDSASYRVEDLEQVWRQVGAADRGMAIGAGIGFFGGALGGFALSGICAVSCSRPSGSAQLQGALVGGLVGAVAIGAVGLYAAAPSKRWKSVYKSLPARLTPVMTLDRIGIRLAF